MNTLFFEYALEVDRTRSISQAAENLYMAQPNLSKVIREMEETLGFPIFERSSRGVVPTAQGTEFLTYAREIMRQMDGIRSIGEPGRANAHSFHISIPRGSYISDAFVSFASALPGDGMLDLEVRETNSMDTIRSVSGGQFKLGVIRYHIHHERYFMDYLSEKKLTSDLIWEFDDLLLMAEEHPLAKREKINLEMLIPYTEILHGDDTVPYLPASRQEETESVFGSRIFLYERGNQFELLSRVPSTYMWVSPIPEHIARRFSLVQRRCAAPERRYRDVLIYPEGYAFRPIDMDFIDRLHEAKNRVAYANYR